VAPAVPFIRPDIPEAELTESMLAQLHHFRIKLKIDGHNLPQRITAQMTVKFANRTEETHTRRKEESLEANLFVQVPLMNPNLIEQE
jgi:hypothetical protein